MSNQQKRTFRILLSIAIVLAVALAAVLIYKSRSAAAAEEAEAQAQADAVITQEQEYNALSYYNGSATLSFTLDEAGSWVWADDPTFPLNQTTVTAIVDLLTSLTPQQTITDGDTLEAYGLDNPSATLTASGEDGASLSLTLGKTTTDGQSYYMMMNGDESTVYIIAGTLYNYLSTPIYDMCILPEIPDMAEENLSSVTVLGTVSTTLTASQEETDTAGEAEEGSGDADAAEEDAAVTVTWTDNQGTDVTDNELLTALLTELEAFTLDKCADWRPSDEAASICGFDAPSAVAEIAMGETTLTITVGGATLDGTGYYVRLDDDTTIYQATTDNVDTLLSVAAGGIGA